jgi:hypothetical protein
MPGILLFAADAFIAAASSSGRSHCSVAGRKLLFGGAIALAAFAGAVGGLLLGRLIDAGHGTRAAIVALVVLAATTTLRAVSVGNAPLAVLANASGALVACLYVPVLGTAIYNQAKRSPCTLR